MWVLASGGAGAGVTGAVASRADGTGDAAAAGRVALTHAAPGQPRKHEVQWPGGGSLAEALGGEGRPAFRFLVPPGATVFAFGFWS